MSSRILLLADNNYRRFAKPILNREGYVVPTQKPSQYAGLGNQLLDLVIQEVIEYEPEGRDSDLALTRRVVADIRRSKESISMLILSSRRNPEDMRNFMRVLRKLDPISWDYLDKTFNEDDLLKQVKKLLGET